MTENGRETLEVDVLFVGAGPASLAGAYRLAELVQQHNAKGEGANLDPMIAIIEKSADVGAHILSGAVLDPRALGELIPDFREDGVEKFGTPVTHDAVYYLTQGRGHKFPITPPPLRNEGKFVISLSDMTKWLAERVMAKDVQIFPGFAGAEMLYDGDRVVGVRTGDKGVNKDGQRKPNYEPGIDLKAAVTILGEGSRGSLAKTMFAKLGMHSPTHPQTYGIGIKELWRVPSGRLAKGSVLHTMGYPLRSQEYGGAWCYAVDDDLLSLGLVVALDYKDPFLDPHERTQRLKEHPMFRRLLEGGKLEHYGAATLPYGGYFATPRLYHDGVLVIGDSAGMLNSQRLKGIHLGMKTGMLAAEAAFEALVRQDSSAAVLKSYHDKFEASWAREELWKVRNFHQAFQGGLWSGMFHAGLQMFSGGRGLRDPWPATAGHEHMRQVEEYYGKPYGRAAANGGGVLPQRSAADGTLTQEKLTSVYHSDTGHEEDQPCHLVVRDLDLCHNRCTREYGNPCQHFCPAAVYEWLPKEDGQQTFQINFSNCVHCKTCDIMDPYQIIDWVTPEGGGGPRYSHL